MQKKCIHFCTWVPYSTQKLQCLTKCCSNTAQYAHLNNTLNILVNIQWIFIGICVTTLNPNEVQPETCTVCSITHTTIIIVMPWTYESCSISESFKNNNYQSWKWVFWIGEWTPDERKNLIICSKRNFVVEFLHREYIFHLHRYTDFPKTRSRLAKVYSNE